MGFVQAFFIFFPMARQPLGGLGLLIFRGFAITHLRHTILGRTPLDEWPACRRDLYLTTDNTHKGQTSMPPRGIRTHNPRKRAAVVDPRLRPRDHWDRLCTAWLSLTIHYSDTIIWFVTVESDLPVSTLNKSYINIWRITSGRETIHALCMGTRTALYDRLMWYECNYIIWTL
jgi:hypothetical protein